jgi:large subunit ribosomal protein L3
MSIGILGTKVGMTQVFDKETGRAIPVTVVQAGPCTVTQIKTKQTDGYESVQLGYYEVKEKALSRPELGHLKKADAKPLRHLQEFLVDAAGEWTVGQEIKSDLFAVGQLVDVSGDSIGRGFAGWQKRHNFARGPMTHGSKNHREPGSTGAGTTPGRVYPGKKMAGRLGGKRITVKKLSVIKVDAESNLILIAGSVPGKPGTLLRIIPEVRVGK